MYDAAPNDAGLICRDLVKSYGRIEVLRSIDIALRPGSVLGLIGENGAGKSTFNNIIAGVVAPSGGEMWLDGAPYAPHSPSDALARGVALIHQEIRLLPGLSVAENLFLGRLPMRGGRVDRASMEEQSRAVLADLGLDIDPRRPVRGLSMAVQQSIEIAKALLREPRYVIFDEPTAALGETDAELIFEQIHRLRAQGTGIVYVSHRLDEITALADQVVCFRDGAKVGEWHDMPVPKEEMINAMVGREFTFAHHAPDPVRGTLALRVEGLGRAGVFENITFDLQEGEILGFAGLVGAGRTDVVRAIAGADRAETGRIEVAGQEVRIATPRQAIDAGITMVPEDRKGLGLNLDRSASANITLPWEAALARFGLIRPADVEALGRSQRERFDIRGRMELPVGSMSGGNQQKVLLAKWLATAPRLLVLHEPTQAVDVGARRTIGEAVRRAADEGCAVLVAGTDETELTMLCDRVLVFRDGRPAARLTGDFTPDEVVEAIFSGHIRKRLRSASPPAGDG